MQYLMGFGILLMIIGWILSIYYKLDNIYRMAQERFEPICKQLRTRYQHMECLLEGLHPHLDQDQALLRDLEEQTETLQHLLTELSLSPLSGPLMLSFCTKEAVLALKTKELLALMNKHPAVFSLNEINSMLSKLGASETPIEAARNNFNQAVKNYIEFSSKAPMKFVAYLFNMDEPLPYDKIDQES